jgi:hypothetical protein
MRQKARMPAPSGITGLLRHPYSAEGEGSSQMHRAIDFSPPPIATGGDQSVNHAGAREGPELADAVVLTAVLSVAGDGMNERPRELGRGGGG